MGLKKLVDELWVGLTGNRLSLIGNILIAASVYEAHQSMKHTYNKILEADKFQGATPSEQAMLITACVGSVILIISRGGLGTLETYRRTKKHIERFGRLDERFTRKIIEEKPEQNGKFLGYCQTQGMYLAARKLKQLDTFYSVKAKVSENIIPNF